MSKCTAWTLVGLSLVVVSCGRLPDSSELRETNKLEVRDDTEERKVDRAQAPPTPTAEPVTSSNTAASTDSFQPLIDARLAGWEIVERVIGLLEDEERPEFAGIDAFLTQYHDVTAGISSDIPPDKWPDFDIDAFTIHNPVFWRAYYEAMPGDSGMILLHAGLLLSGGEMVRASHQLLIAQQAAGIPQGNHQAIAKLTTALLAVEPRPNALVQEGFTLQDDGDLAGAMEKHRAALRLWPQFGFGHFALAKAMFIQQAAASGKGIPVEFGAVFGDDLPPSPEVTAGLARARHHDPFSSQAYQGGSIDDGLGTFLTVKMVALPLLKEIQSAGPGNASLETIEEFAETCQEIGYHELALTTQQIVIRRTRHFKPENVDFMATSLEVLAPGPYIEELKKNLGKTDIRVWQLPALGRSNDVDKSR